LNFFARYSAKSRIYRYYICFEKKAVNGDKFHRIKTEFDIDLAGKFCKLLIGIHSFKSLCKNKSDDHDFLSDVKYAKIRKLKNNVIEFEICASRFLHSMVRAILGVMISIAAGKMSIKDFQSKFKKGENITIQYVPAKALFLYKVNY
jgi:tRNA pseudouridine38-40 synthase